MYCVLCNMYYVPCTMYYVLCTMYYLQCTMHSGRITGGGPGGGLSPPSCFKDPSSTIDF